MSRYAFDGSSELLSREALRCLANALFLRPPVRQTFIDLGYAGRTADKYARIDSFENEFLCARILLVITYETKLDYRVLIEEQALAESLSRSLDRHASSSSSDSEEMALSEALKLTYNLLHNSQALAARFTDLLPKLLTLLVRLSTPGDISPNASIRHLINVLMISDLAPPSLFPPANPNEYVDPLIDALEGMVKATPEQELDAVASPVSTLLRRILEIAPVAVKQSMQLRLLPTATDRHKPLGRSATLSSRLLRLSVSGFTPLLRDSIPHLLFELSDSNAEQFVNNVGYGYASGFLTNNNIPAPAPHKETNSGDGDDVNFITGQYLRDQPQDHQNPMTDDEKMREAERLFVLFERMKKTGVMGVQNPVEEAVQSGKFEEIE
ncbi:MAG: hypothetical protein M1828_003912 [Chrysothrix sp. TS-e1954]|nr:MAG: hypothetical protein M1828_003912 [Chrysothrix sp. TS-e1954]